MNRQIQLSGICFLVFLFSSNNSFTQWEPDVRLTNNSGASLTSHNNAWCIAAKGDTVHVVWTDNSNGVASEIYYKRSVNGGLSWQADTLLSGQGNASYNPSITVRDSYVYIVWVDERDGNREIYFKGSSDGGSTWGFDDRVTTNSASSEYPSIAVSGSFVHVVFEDDRDSNKEIYYRRSTDNGNFWVNNTRLTNNNYSQYSPSVAASGLTVHVIWTDPRDSNTEIYYKRSSDGGLNWGTDTRLTLNSEGSVAASITVSGSIVHVVWEDERDGNTETYYKRSTDEGLSWGADIRLTNDSATSLRPSIACAESIVHIIWDEYRSGLNGDIYYKRSTDNGSTWEPDTRLTYDYRSFGLDWKYQSVAASGPSIHVVWTDQRNSGNAEIYYKRNPTGEPTDVEFINVNIPNEYILFQNYPNPFNPATTIKYQLGNDGFVTLKVFNSLGEEVAELVDQFQKAGSHQIIFNAAGLPSGVYVGKLSSGNFTETKKMLILK